MIRFRSRSARPQLRSGCWWCLIARSGSRKCLQLSFWGRRWSCARGLRVCWLWWLGISCPQWCCRSMLPLKVWKRRWLFLVLLLCAQASSLAILCKNRVSALPYAVLLLLFRKRSLFARQDRNYDWKLQQEKLVIPTHASLVPLVPYVSPYNYWKMLTILLTSNPVSSWSYWSTPSW